MYPYVPSRGPMISRPPARRRESSTRIVTHRDSRAHRRRRRRRTPRHEVRHARSIESRSIATTRRAEASRGVRARGDGAYARAIRARSRSIVRWNRRGCARAREPARAGGGKGESRVRGGMRERCARASRASMARVRGVARAGARGMLARDTWNVPGGGLPRGTGGSRAFGRWRRYRGSMHRMCD